MELHGLIVGWRALSFAVSEKAGQPLGTGKVRYRAENCGFPVGQRIGNSIVFTEDEVEAIARLFEAGQEANR